MHSGYFLLLGVKLRFDLIFFKNDKEIKKYKHEFSFFVMLKLYCFNPSFIDLDYDY